MEPEAEQPEHDFKAAIYPDGPVLSINQLVSYNLMRARRANGWTQQDLAHLLERYTGRPWSNASVSAAERAWQGGRTRRFDAGELVALAKIFDVPISYFFLTDSDEVGKFLSMSQAESVHPAEDPMALIPAASVLEMALIREPPLDFLGRAKRAAKRWLMIDWEPPTWSVTVKPGFPNPLFISRESPVTPGAPDDKRDAGDDTALSEWVDRYLSGEERLSDGGPSRTEIRAEMMRNPEKIENNLGIDPRVLEAIIAETSHAAVMHFIKNVRKGWGMEPPEAKEGPEG